MDKTIIFDFDNTLVKSTEAILKCYRKETGDYSTSIEEHLKDWGLHGLCPLWSDYEITKAFSSQRFFNYLEPMNYSEEVLTKLKSKGYNLVVVSKHIPDIGIVRKLEYIFKYFKQIDDVAIIRMNENMRMDKSLINGWLSIDDNLDCLESINTRYKIAFGTNPYTQTDKYPIAKGFIQLLDFIEQLEDMDTMVNNFKQN